MCVQISFKRPDEYLTEVKGTAGKVSGQETITSLTFITNQRHFGPYGRPAGKAFESSPGKEVSGFFGRCSSHLDQIGVITGPPGHQDSATDGALVQGPWGGQRGSQFYSGRGDLQEIFVTFNQAHIVALQATYSLGTQADNFKSDWWGAETGDTVKVLTVVSRNHILLIRNVFIFMSEIPLRTFSYQKIICS